MTRAAVAVRAVTVAVAGLPRRNAISPIGEPALATTRLAAPWEGSGSTSTQPSVITYMSR
jgi:hypothetical protein